MIESNVITLKRIMMKARPILFKECGNLYVCLKWTQAIYENDKREFNDIRKDESEMTKTFSLFCGKNGLKFVRYPNTIAKNLLHNFYQSFSYRLYFPLETYITLLNKFEILNVGEPDYEKSNNIEGFKLFPTFVKESNIDYNEKVLSLFASELAGNIEDQEDIYEGTVATDSDTYIDIDDDDVNEPKKNNIIKPLKK